MTFYLSTKPVFIPSTLPLKIVRQRSESAKAYNFFLRTKTDSNLIAIFFILVTVGNYRNYKGRIPSEVLSPNLELKRNLSDSHK